MRRWLKRLIILILALGAILLCVIGPIDRTPIEEKTHYTQTLQILDTLSINEYPATEPLLASWGKTSITPDHVMPMAGYRIRPRFDAVHDSLYARVIHVYNGKSVYFISLDLLLFPPLIKEKLAARFSKQNDAPILFSGATHTHNGVGGWNKSIGGEVILGDYDSVWVNNVVDKISSLIIKLEHERGPARIGFWQTSAQEFVENRLSANSPTDGVIRGFQVIRNDSSTARLVTFSAHPTTISKSVLQLSGDYPAFLNKSLENKNVFGMFMAGMVGSHRLAGFNESDDFFERAELAGKGLAERVIMSKPIHLADSITIRSTTLPLQFAPSQLRIHKNFKLRNWIFSWMLDPLQGDLQLVEIGNMAFVGTPCDFSGELYVTQQFEEAGKKVGKEVLITSFNGNYVGYITEDVHYDTQHKEEVMAMNWVGPNHGTFYSELINKLIQK